MIRHVRPQIISLQPDIPWVYNLTALYDIPGYQRGALGALLGRWSVAPLVTTQSGEPTAGGSGINMFADPQATYQQFRQMILGLDGRFGNFLHGFPGWNLDMAVRKTMRSGRISGRRSCSSS
jgi:hypothetical protein